MTLLGPSKGKHSSQMRPISILGFQQTYHRPRRLAQYTSAPSAEGFDLIIDARINQSSTTQSILALTGNAPTRLGFQPPHGRPLRTQCPTFQRTKKVTKSQRLQLLKALGHSVISPRLPDLSHAVTKRGQRITAWLEAAEVRHYHRQHWRST